MSRQKFVEPQREKWKARDIRHAIHCRVSRKKRTFPSPLASLCVSHLVDGNVLDVGVETVVPVLGKEVGQRVVHSLRVGSANGEAERAREDKERKGCKINCDRCLTAAVKVQWPIYAEGERGK